VFIRSVGLSLCRTWSKKIRWINRFEDGTKIRVLVPYYLSLVGDENFVLDAFVDDITDKRVEINTDQVPRAIITFENASLVSSEFANPNQYLSQKAQINNEIRNIISKVKAAPVRLNYKVEIKLASERDLDLCHQKIWDAFFNYKFFRIDYYGLNIDANFKLPDDTTIEINREDSLTTDQRYKKITYNIEVITYYPIFKVNIDDLEVCNNDDDINWEDLEVPQPSSDFCQSLEAYYQNFGQKGITCNFNRVFWKNYFYKLQDYPADKPTKDDGTPDIDKWEKYNL
jgi:hypothetical protein